jgi:hypothetical protein
LKSQKGSVLPFFAMTRVIMLLIVFLILDIGKAHIVQSDEFKATDSSALAGATQADNHEKVKYKQVSHKEPVYKKVNVYDDVCGYFGGDRWRCKKVKTGSKKVFDHWKEIKSDPVRTVIDKWAVIREKDAKELALKIYNKNAESTSLISNLINDGGELYFNSRVTKPDQFETKVQLDTKFNYFPAFSEGLFNKERGDVLNKVRIQKESESKAEPITW